MNTNAELHLPSANPAKIDTAALLRTNTTPDNQAWLRSVDRARETFVDIIDGNRRLDPIIRRLAIKTINSAFYGMLTVLKGLGQL